MGKMIYTSQKCKNPKKKPGWEEAARQEQEWLAKINGMSLFSQPGRKYNGKVEIGKKVEVVKDGNLSPRVATSTTLPAKYVVGAGTKPVIRPEITYKGNPEMIEREKLARQRKFNIAPAYNKGGAQYVSEEELFNVLKGNKRRP